MTGAAPVPVPPPRPVVTKTMSAPLKTSRIWSVSSSAAARPTFGSAPAPRPLVNCAPICTFTGAALFCRACWSVLATMNSTPLEAGERHAVDGVAAAAADANHFDAGARANDVLVQKNPELLGTVGLEVASIHIERSFPGPRKIL